MLTSTRENASPLDSKFNNIGVIRLILALSVIVHHAWYLGAFGPDIAEQFSRGRTNLGEIAVHAFFVLSGLLITKSCLRSPSVGRYLWNRVLRIYPAYWVCLVVVGFLIAPAAVLIERGSLAGYFNGGPDGPFAYVLHNFTLGLRQLGISGAFTSTPVPYKINGSIWTLVPEFKCYLVVAAVGLLGLQGAKRLGIVRFVLPSLAAALYLMNALPGVAPHIPLVSPILAKTFEQPGLLRMLTYFFIGSTCYIYRDAIRLNAKAAFGALALTLVAMPFHFAEAIVPPALCYFFLWIAFAGHARWFNDKVDFSYGVYIYGWPVQQLLLTLGLNRYGLIPLAAISMLAVLPFAACSWYFIESPMLKLKSLNLKRKAAAEILVASAVVSE